MLYLFAKTLKRHKNTIRPPFDDLQVSLQTLRDAMPGKESSLDWIEIGRSSHGNRPVIARYQAHHTCAGKNQGVAKRHLSRPATVRSLDSREITRTDIR